MYRYLFLCKIHPKSGMDLAKHNKAVKLLGKMLKDTLDGSPESNLEILESWNNYKEEIEGFVLEMVPIVSDKIIEDPEVEVMPEIRVSYPEAEMVRYLQIPGGLGYTQKSEIATELALFN